MTVVVYFIYVQLFSITRLYFFMCNQSKNHAVVKLDFIHLAGKKQYFFFIFQSPDGKYIVSGAIDGIIIIFYFASGKLVHTLEGIIWSVS